PRPPADSNASEGLLQPFFKEEMAHREGTAYSGVLFTFGPHLLIQNVFFQRPWFEVEVKIKGKIATSQKVLGWDFKVGMRYVFSNEIEPTVYASISRDRTDFNDARLSIIKNTRFDLRMDKGLGTNNFWRFTAIVGKNFPIKKSRFAFSLSVGAIININSPYDQKLTGLDPLDLFHMVFQPGLIF
ncbi:MAG: hypothetical protein JNM63_06785, partial [Spirochaetia bacterium]|nr:hypothetical protein [Spirochaetia bacterium]